MKGSSTIQCIASDCVSVSVIDKEKFLDDDEPKRAQHSNDRIHSAVPNPLREFASSRKESTLKSRKRSINKATDNVAMSSYNSDFLSGLFADIAKATTNSDSEVSSKTLITKDILHECSRANKKSRISLTKSISRCEKSFANLLDVSSCPSAPTTKMARDESLHHQLHCISSGSSSESDSLHFAADIGKLAFPHLPNTVSDSSCSHISDNVVSDTSTENTLRVERESTDSKEAYGWFVNTDVDDDVKTAKVTSQSTSSKNTCDLAFSAVTAPKISNQDAEVEWAKAADTVDDVLGDFF